MIKDIPLRNIINLDKSYIQMVQINISITPTW